MRHHTTIDTQDSALLVFAACFFVICGLCCGGREWTLACIFAFIACMMALLALVDPLDSDPDWIGGCWGPW